jgi:hypothetical protein
LKIYFNNGGTNTANIGATSGTAFGQSIGNIAPSSLA